MEIIDSHVHLWDPIKTPREVSFLNKILGFNPRLLDKVANLIFPKSAREFFGSPQYITRPYLLDNYKTDCGSQSVKGIIHVEAGWKGKEPGGPVNETKWLKAVNSDSNPKILAIIANANLENWNSVEPVLTAHLEASELVKGVRETLAWQPKKEILNGSKNPNLFTNVKWKKGFEVFSNFNLSFEATIYHNQIIELAKLAGEYPNVKIMLSHLATPVAVAGEFGGNGKTKKEREEVFSSWKDAMSRLAENHNVHVKLSGLAMPICGFGWHNKNSNPSIHEVADSFAPYIYHAVKVFGDDRCLFGSNYPIDKVSLPLESLLKANKIILKDFTDGQRHKIFYLNALNFYNINPESV